MQRHHPQQFHKQTFAPPPPAQQMAYGDDEDDYYDEEEDDFEGDDDTGAHLGTAANGSSKPMHLSEQRFADLAKAGLISAPTAKAITESMKFEFLTIVQAATLKHLLTGADWYESSVQGH